MLRNKIKNNLFIELNKCNKNEILLNVKKRKCNILIIIIMFNNIFLNWKTKQLN